MCRIRRSARWAGVCLKELGFFDRFGKDVLDDRWQHCCDYYSLDVYRRGGYRDGLVLVRRTDVSASPVATLFGLAGRLCLLFLMARGSRGIARLRAGIHTGERTGNRRRPLQEQEHRGNHRQGSFSSPDHHFNLNIPHAVPGSAKSRAVGERTSSHVLTIQVETLTSLPKCIKARFTRTTGNE